MRIVQPLLLVACVCELVACGGYEVDADKLTQRMSAATRNAVWLDHNWNTAIKGEFVAVGDGWRLQIARHQCQNASGLAFAFMFEDRVTTEACDGKREGWEWQKMPLSLPLMLIDPDSITVVSGNPDDKTSGHTVAFRCGARRCWGDVITPDGILCRDHEGCEAVAADLKTLITLAAEAGAESVARSGTEVAQPVAAPNTTDEPYRVISAAEGEALFGIARPGETPVEAMPAKEQMRRGAQHEYGQGVSVNLFEAIRWYRAAAEQGDFDAQMKMASAYEQGRGVPIQLAEALKWYRTAGANEDPRATDAEEEGNDLEVIQDWEEVVNPGEAVYHAIWILELLDDKAKAREVLLPHARNGDVLAQYVLGRTYVWDHQQDKDPGVAEQEAIRWLLPPANDGFVWAELELAGLHDWRAGWFSPDRDSPDYLEARRWYRAAAAQGSPAALEWLRRQEPESVEPPVQRTAPPAPPPVTPPQPADLLSRLPVCESIHGQWQWNTGVIPGVLTFAADNSVVASPTQDAQPVLRGVWSCDEPRSSFVIQWQNGVVEHLTLAADHRSISGKNNFGAFIQGTPLQ